LGSWFLDGESTHKKDGVEKESGFGEIPTEEAGTGHFMKERIINGQKLRPPVKKVTQPSNSDPYLTS
jgi:hypothetical protein